MRYSPEASAVFVEAVDCGSFSTAARHLRKSQSTISTAITNLEVNFGVTLFDRVMRQSTLTPQEEQVLSYVKAILVANERLDELAVPLAGEAEPRLTFVLLDTLHPDVLEDLLMQFSRRLPHTELEYLTGEDEDVIDPLQRARAQVELVEVGDRYPTDIGSARLLLRTAMSIYVAPNHPLATQDKVVWDELRSWCELRLNTFSANTIEPAAGQIWSAPNYLLLLNMAVQGLGWCILPCVLTAESAPQGGPVALDVPGWPRAISVDPLQNKKALSGTAGSWLCEHLQRRER